LDDDLLRAVAVRKLEGHTNQKTAELLGFSKSTIERCLQRIREKWREP
jgi:DNA-directed RNA polymerase specialized sigma24 family protein